MTRTGINAGLKLASVVVAAAIGALHAFGDGPVTSRDWLSLAGAVAVAVFGYLHTAPADEPPKVAPPAP